MEVTFLRFLETASMTGNDLAKIPLSSNHCIGGMENNSVAIFD